MSSSEELERHLLAHFDKLECSFIEEWSTAGGDLPSLTAAQSFEAVVRLLWVIRPSLRSRLPSFLFPPSATARFRMATLVAEAVKEVGVREKVGFQDLLYGTGKELSALFISLIQLVPKEGEEEHEEEITFHSSLLRRARLAAADDVLWVPEFCRVLKLKHDGRFWCPGENESELFPLSFGRPLDSILEGAQTDRREIAAALYREDQEESKPFAPSAVSPSSAATPRVKPALPPKPSLKPETAPPSAAPSVEDEAARREREEAERELREAETFYADCKAVEEKIRKKRARMAEERQTIEAELAAYDEKLMTILEDPTEARAKIEKYMDDREERAAKLEAKWEAARAEKMEELSELREEAKRKSGPSSVQDRLRRARAEAERLQTAKELYERRTEKLSRRVALINDDDAVNRHAYVKKLMEVTGNLKKQREQLHKVWRETDMVMKDIKWSEQAAMRTFDLLEEAFYKNTNRSPKDERLYKNLVTMYNKCQLIVKEAENVGASKKRKEELVDQLDQAKSSPFLAQLTPMIEDLTSIEEENRRLEQLLENA